MTVANPKHVNRWIKVLAVTLAAVGLLWQFGFQLDISRPFKFTDEVCLYQTDGEWIGKLKSEGKNEPDEFQGSIRFRWIERESGFWAPTRTYKGTWIQSSLYYLDLGPNIFVDIYNNEHINGQEQLDALIAEHPEARLALDAALVVLDNAPSADFTRAQAMTLVQRRARPLGYFENALGIVMLGVLLVAALSFLRWFIRTLLTVSEVDPTICPSCGYSLEGLPSTTCPECGSIPA